MKKIKEFFSESHRIYHFILGFAAGILTTIVGAALVGATAEMKDLQWNNAMYDMDFKKWKWFYWDWGDFLSTLLGGALGNVILVCIVLMLI